VLESEPLQPELADQLSPQAQALVGHGASQVFGQTERALPGQVVGLVAGVGLVVATGEGAILVRRGLLEGRRVSEGSLLLEQLQAQVGDRFDVVSASSGPAA